jgi:hypothetical protein
MIYIFTEGEETFTVKAPDSIDHKTAIRLILCNEKDKWIFAEMVPDNNYPAGTEHNNIEELLYPSLFVNFDPDTGDIVPDMDYVPHVTKQFMEDMLYLWSKSDRADWIPLMDKIDAKLDYLIDSAIIQDIIE